MIKSREKVLVTGAGGFIGSHLVELLLRKDYSIKAFVRYNSMSSFGWLDHIPESKKLEVHMGDIRDKDSVLDAMSDCNMVYHLAALIGIPYSYISPLAYIKTNIEGTYNILESARHLEIKNIVIVSTSETYGTAQYIPIDEQHPLVGQSPYSASKIGADQLAISYYRSFGIPVKIAKPFNTYGPRQSARAVIPSIITQILAGKPEIELGSLTPTRDLNFVKDTVNAIFKISECEEFLGEVTNIGTNTEISIGHLFSLINKLLGNKAILMQKKNRIRPTKSEVERLICDNTKIISRTSWKPVYDLESGLTETIDWFKNNMGKYRPNKYNI
jgi:NAD dependent epimerase/dehydratase